MIVGMWLSGISFEGYYNLQNGQDIMKGVFGQQTRMDRGIMTVLLLAYFYKQKGKLTHIGRVSQIR